MYDVAVIGSEPAGMGAALYLKRAGKNPLIIERIFEGTGQMSNSICVENYLGFPSIAGEELGEKFRRHVLSQQISFLEDEVTGIIKDHDWKLTLESGEMVEAKAVIYAAGTYPKKLNIPGEEEFQGRGVSYCAYCDGSLFKGKEVAVIGGGDSFFCSDWYQFCRLCQYRKNEACSISKPVYQSK